MKKIKLLLFAAIAFAAVQVNAQTVDEIVNKHIEAMGGKTKLATLKTVKMTGNMSAQGAEVAMTITKSHLIGMRIDMEINGTSNYQLANTKTGWVFMPIMGMSDPTEMEAEQYKSIISQMDIQGALVDYKEKGTKVELVKTEKVEGAEAYNLKLTYKDGKESNYYIDKTTGRLIKTSSTANVQGNEMTIETVFSDYKQNADGYWFSYSLKTMQGTLNIDKVETNISVDEKIYSN